MSGSRSSSQKKFESDVIPDSGKTIKRAITNVSTFESDVIPDSGKTSPSA